MLKKRLLTAALLIPFVVAAILFLPTNIVNILLLAVSMLAGIEWLHITGRKNTPLIAVMVAGLLLAGGAAWYLSPAEAVLILAAVIWLFALLLVTLFAHKPIPVCLASLFKNSYLNYLIALLLFTSFSYCASWIHQSAANGPALLLYTLVAVWLADTGGYFAGKRFGQRKLATAISPNKTWEGVAGAIVLSSTWAVIFHCFISSAAVSLAGWLLLNLVVVIFAIAGDLFESVFKRLFAVKDSGNLLPGHGGMLDRIDSLLAAVPAFALMMYLLGVK